MLQREMWDLHDFSYPNKRNGNTYIGGGGSRAGGIPLGGGGIWSKEEVSGDVDLGGTLGVDFEGVGGLGRLGDPPHSPWMMGAGA